MNSESAKLKLEGNNFFRRKRYGEAIEMYKKGLQICDTGKHLFHSNIAACYIMLSDYENGFFHSMKCLSLEPSFEKGQYRVILCLMKMGRFEEANSHFKRVKSTQLISKFKSALKKELKVRDSPFRMFPSTPSSPQYPRRNIMPPNPMMMMMTTGFSPSSNLSIHDVEEMHLFVHNGDIFCLGDRTEETSLCRLFFLNSDYSRWIEKATSSEKPPVNLGCFGCKKVDNKVYIFGGLCETFENQEHSSSPSNDLFVLHLDSMNWEKIKPINEKPSARMNFGFLHHNNKLFILFGFICSRIRRESCRSSILIFDLETNEWNEITKIEFFITCEEKNESMKVMTDGSSEKNGMIERLECLVNDCLIRSEKKVILFEDCNQMTKPGEIMLLKRFYTVEGLFDYDSTSDRVKVVERVCSDDLSIEDRIRRHQEYGDEIVHKLKNSTVVTYNPFSDSLLLFDPYFSTFLSFSYSDHHKSTWISSSRIYNEEVMTMMRELIPMDPLASICKHEDFVSGKGMIVKDGVVFIMGMMSSRIMTRVFMGETENNHWFYGRNLHMNWRRNCFRSRKFNVFCDVIVCTNV